MTALLRAWVIAVNAGDHVTANKIADQIAEAS